MQTGRMVNYVEQGKGKTVRVKFPNLGHILQLESLSQRWVLIFRVMIVAKDNALEFEWDHRVYASDETVNIELNEVISRNPGVQISFSKK